MGRGYGYADFQDRESLVDVLTMTDLAVNNRKMRIDLASQAGKDRSGGFEDRGDRREGGVFLAMNHQGTEMAEGGMEDFQEIEMVVEEGMEIGMDILEIEKLQKR